MKAAKVTVPVILAASINIVQDIRPSDKGGTGGKNVTKVVFGSVALFAGLTAVGEFVDWDIASILAILFLLHTLLADGQEVIGWFTSLTATL